MWVCFGVALLAAATAVHAWNERAAQNPSLRSTFFGEPIRIVFVYMCVFFFFCFLLGCRREGTEGDEGRGGLAWLLLLLWLFLIVVLLFVL